MRVLNVEYLEDYKLKIKFSDKKTKIVDCEEKVKHAKGIFLPLKNVEYFKQVSVDDKFLSLTTAKFGRIFGVTHAAVIQWENGKRQLTPSTEFCIRLHVLGHLRAKATEFRDLYNAVPLEVLAKEKIKTTAAPLEIDVSQNFKVA